MQMSDSAPALRSEQEPLADSDYETILGAVMETARGRWFLHEYAHRNRNADTGMLLSAINRIESLLTTREAASEPAASIADASMTDAATSVSANLAQLREVAENLIECGAPTYLCNDLLRRIEQLALAYAKPASAQATISARPAAQVVQNLVEIVVAEPRRDPFADILALSPEERIALFT